MKAKRNHRMNIKIETYIAFHLKRLFITQSQEFITDHYVISFMRENFKESEMFFPSKAQEGNVFCIILIHNKDIFRD